MATTNNIQIQYDCKIVILRCKQYIHLNEGICPHVFCLVRQRLSN